MSDPRDTPARAAWDYGLPQAAVEQVDATIRDVFGHWADNGVIELGPANTSRLVVRNAAAAIVYDLVTSGAVLPALPDVPPPMRGDRQDDA